MMNKVTGFRELSKKTFGAARLFHKRGSKGHCWRRLSRLTPGSLASFVILPTLVVLAVAIAVGPTLWRKLYPPVKDFCVAHLAHLDPGHIAWNIVWLLAFLSLGALVLVLAREMVLSARLRSSIARRRAATPESVRQLQRRYQLQVPIVCTDEDRLYAFCYGLRRPAIVISSGLNKALAEPEIEAVLLHEVAHAIRRDPLKIFVSRLMARALFYIPLLHRMQERYVLRLEISADQRVVDSLGVRPLAAALSKMLQAPVGTRPVPVTAGMANATEERILHLLEPNRKLPSVIFSKAESITISLVVIISGFLGGGFAGVVNSLVLSGAFCNFQA